MNVIKRNGTFEPVEFDKITLRLQNLCYGLTIDPILITKKIIEGLYNNIHTSELDRLAAEILATMIHPDYGKLASRISVSNLQKTTKEKFSEVITDLYEFNLIDNDVFSIVLKNVYFFNSLIHHENDFNYDYFGFKTLEKSYLLKINGSIVERPQHMLLRVAIGIHLDDLNLIATTYDLMSNGYFIHATPTLFNSGTPKPQLSSCFLLTMKEDSISGIFDTLKQTAQISQNAGGIGLSIHNVRASGSYIAGCNGSSSGIIPMLRVFNSTARYVDQGGKRKGAFAIYIEPWHADIFEFLNLKKNTGNEEQKARDLFYGLWIPDLFMKRVKNNENWTLMCPNECPGLSDCHGEKFEQLYEKYESKGRQTIKARELWEKIIISQIETGTPYMLYKDAANIKSNQQNLGTIKSSNLCTEIIEYTSDEEIAVCNLASIALPMFVNRGKFNFEKLFDVAKHVIKNLNRIIDRNYYPVVEARTSNLRNRPVGLGVQGLADVFMKLKLPFTKAKKINKDIFETLYFAALTASMELSKIEGPYETYHGSPISKGLFQFNLWKMDEKELSGMWDWNNLRLEILKYGVRNSLLIAPMPTASTSQILGNNEAFEPYTSNLFTRRVLSGEFIVFNKHLLKDLIDLNLWNDEVKNQLIIDNGSVKNLNISETLKEIYKTVWEMSMKDIITMSRDRGYFVDQSQSLNLFVKNPTISKLSSMHFYAWECGLKTGMYYLRTTSSVDAIKITVCESCSA